MASEAVTLSVRPRGNPVKKLPEEVSVPFSGPASDLYKQIALKANTSFHRLRVTKGSDGALIPNSKEISISSTGLRDQSTIYVKDLGPQMAWRTVFILEYLGPLLIHPLAYISLTSSPSYLQTLSLALLTIHFLKRELETVFVHRFSAATMPASNLFKNSAHYWILAGANIAFFTYRPSSPAAGKSNPYITYLALALFTIGELANLSTHLTLRGLRSSGGTERQIPKGLGFSWVTCPNYGFETMAWIGIVMVTWSWSTVFFAVVAVAQMGLWGQKKEQRYRKEFGDVYKKKRGLAAQVEHVVANLLPGVPQCQEFSPCANGIPRCLAVIGGGVSSILTSTIL